MRSLSVLLGLCFMLSGCCTVSSDSDGKIMRQGKKAACKTKEAVDNSIVGDVDRLQKEILW